MKTQALSALASELVRAGLEGMAARGHDGAHKFNGSGDEPVTQGGGPSPSPRLNAEGSASNVNGMKCPSSSPPYSGERGKGPSEQAPGSEWNVGARKEADAETPASASREEVRVETVRRPVLDTPLTMSRSMATVYSTAPHRESFARSAVVIDLSMWKERHSTASGAC